MLRLADTVGLILEKKGGQVWSIRPDESVYAAIAMMAEKGVGSLLVIGDGALVGILSERDYARRVILQGKSSKTTQVKEIMTSPVVFVTRGHSIEECMQIMTSCRIRHLPVLEEKNVIGLVSIGDVVKWLLSEREGTIRELEHYIAGTYPG